MDVDHENLERANTWLDTHSKDDKDWEYYARLKIALERVLSMPRMTKETMLFLVFVLCVHASTCEASSLAIHAHVVTVNAKVNPNPNPDPISDVCDNCNGTGKSGDGIATCVVCGGTGRKPRQAAIGAVLPSWAKQFKMYYHRTDPSATFYYDELNRKTWGNCQQRDAHRSKTFRTITPTFQSGIP